jgi:hypothetical protein
MTYGTPEGVESKVTLNASPSHVAVARCNSQRPSRNSCRRFPNGKWRTAGGRGTRAYPISVITRQGRHGACPRCRPIAAVFCQGMPGSPGQFHNLTFKGDARQKRSGATHILGLGGCFDVLVITPDIDDSVAAFRFRTPLQGQHRG